MTVKAADPREVLAGLILEDGEPWGRLATDWQHADAAAILAADGPRRHFVMRGRGMSKTSDVAAIALSLLLACAPARSRSYAYAVDADQSAILMDALAGFVARSGLAGFVELGPRSVTVKASGATLSVESSDGASAFGLRPWLVIADEFAAWPDLSNYRTLWSAIASAQPKVAGSRLVILTTAGSPTGLGARVWQQAERSEYWRAVRRPGPSPWWPPSEVESTRALLTPAEWRRLVLCEWSEGDDSLSSPEDVAACVRPGSVALEPRRGTEYTASLDIGTRRDLSALAVAHAEPTAAGPKIIIDRVLSWRPSKGQRVDLAEVEAATLRVCREYRVSKIKYDRQQAEQMMSNLARAGLRVDEFIFSTAGVNRLARALYTALRDRSVEIPDDPELINELNSARLVEIGHGAVKLQNPAGSHDDMAVTVAMVIADLSEHPVGRGSMVVAGRRWKAPARSAADLGAGVRPVAPVRSRVRQAARTGVRGIGAVIMPGSANDPGRVRRAE